MENNDNTIDTYNKIASHYGAVHFDPFWVDEFDFFKKNIGGNKVIDVGCGAGRDAVVFTENGFEYTGIDASEEMLKVASERVPEGKFRLMDFYKLEFPDSTFNGFWAAASFLHVPKKDINKVLTEAKRIIKPGGIGFISIKEKANLDEGIIEEQKYGGVKRYFAFYDSDEFKKILENSGFKVIKAVTHLEDDERKTNWLCYFVRK